MAIERWINYVDIFCRLDHSMLQKSWLSDSLEVLKTCTCFEAKRGFCSENRYFQGMTIDGKQTNNRWEHLCNKALCFSPENRIYLFYSASERHVVKELLLAELHKLSVRKLEQKISYELTGETKIHGKTISFFFRHFGLEDHLVPIEYAKTSSILKEYLKKFGKFELFAPFKWISTVDHLCIHPVQIEEKSPKESMIENEKTLVKKLENIIGKNG